MRDLIEIKQLETDAIKELRYEVLWPHKNSSSDCTIEPDSAESTFHIGATMGNEVVGTSTLIIDINPNFEEQNQYRLRAMATSPKIRGTRTGVAIVNKAIEELQKRNVKLLWCDARLIATGFYEKLGFKIKGDVYEVPNIGPHKLMYKEI